LDGGVAEGGFATGVFVGFLVGILVGKAIGLDNGLDVGSEKEELSQRPEDVLGLYPEGQSEAILLAWFVRVYGFVFATFPEGE